MDKIDILRSMVNDKWFQGCAAGVGISLASGISILSAIKLWRHIRHSGPCPVSCPASCHGGEKEVAYWNYKRGINLYETSQLFHEYLLFHYGSPEDVLHFDFGLQSSLDFQKRCSDLCMKYVKDDENLRNRALDVGCAVGRTTFELTRIFNEVIGIDSSLSFINACNNLKDLGRMEYKITTEGDLHEDYVAIVDPELDRNCAFFRKGDACCLPLDIGQFGAVLACNVIDRLATPVLFLERLTSLVAPDGVLLITSPYTFSTVFAPKESWIGGYVNPVDGQHVTGFMGLRFHLQKFFDLITEIDMPYVMRSTERTHSCSVSHASVWRRKR